MADHYAGPVMHAPSRFDPASVGHFRVMDRTFDRDSGTVSLRYGLDDQITFSETITFQTPSTERASIAPSCTCTSPPEPATTRRRHPRW